MIRRLLFSALFMMLCLGATAQCSMCTKTAASLDDKSARGLNSGILYLAGLPLLMMGFIGYRWYRQNQSD